MTLSIATRSEMLDAIRDLGISSVVEDGTYYFIRSYEGKLFAYHLTRDEVLNNSDDSDVYSVALRAVGEVETFAIPAAWHHTPTYVGTWTDPRTGNVDFDISVLIAGEHAALELGRAHKQQCVWSWLRMTTVEC